MSKMITLVICIFVFIASYQTHDLDHAENAYLYRLAYALVMARGVVLIAVDVLHLWN